MLNYGIDPGRYKRDIHEILYKTYRGLAKTEDRMVYGKPGEGIRGFIRACYYRIKWASHRSLYYKYSLSSAAAYGTVLSAGGEQQLDALIQYYNAFEAYPRRALGYLRWARAFEVPLIPKSENTYDSEEGILLRDPGLLRRSIPGFDPLWERDIIADAYAELARYAGGKNRRKEKQDAAERLYALNRGALRQRGIPLPVELTIDASQTPNPARAEAALRRVLKKMGIQALPSVSSALPAADTAGTAGSGGRFRLHIALSRSGEGGQAASCEVYDGGRGTTVVRRSIPLAAFTREDLSAFAKILGDAIFVGN
jgi:hypothetical protein